MKWLSKNSKNLVVDIHSHLIPGIDDGAPTVDESLEMILQLKESGFKKLITTPHIHPRFPNTNRKIMSGLESLKDALKEKSIEIAIEAAAEYYIDDQFISLLNEGHEFLTFGDKCILIECSFVSKPFFLESVIYQLKDAGYAPVFAHPERYKFLEGEIGWLKEIKSTGILFQVTLGSLGGYYGTAPRKLGLEIVKNGMVDFLGSDLHKASQVDFLRKGLKLRAVQKLLESDSLLNHNLL